MGKGTEGTEASSGESENNWLGSCKAHYVGISPQEDRRRSTGTLGEGTGGEEEGGLEPREPAPRMRQAFLLEVNLWAVRTVEALK